MRFVLCLLFLLVGTATCAVAAPLRTVISYGCGEFKDAYGSRGLYVVEVPKSSGMEKTESAKPILQASVDAFIRTPLPECSRYGEPKTQRGTVYVLYEGDTESCPEYAQVLQKRGSDAFLSCLSKKQMAKADVEGKRVSYYELKAITLEQQAREKAEQEQVQAAREKEKQEAERQARIAQAPKDLKAKRLAEKYGAIGYVNWEKFKANPFVSEGKVLLFNTSLGQMQTAESGICSDVLFVDIPRGTFVDSRPAMIAGKVLGVTKVVLPIVGETQIPKVRFLGVEFCAEKNCGDFGRMK